jgi:hypothetical protein
MRIRSEKMKVIGLTICLLTAIPFKGHAQDFGKIGKNIVDGAGNVYLTLCGGKKPLESLDGAQKAVRLGMNVLDIKSYQDDIIYSNLLKTHKIKKVVVKGEACISAPDSTTVIASGGLGFSCEGVKPEVSLDAYNRGNAYSVKFDQLKPTGLKTTSKTVLGHRVSAEAPLANLKDVSTSISDVSSEIDFTVSDNFFLARNQPQGKLRLIKLKQAKFVGYHNKENDEVSVTGILYAPSPYLDGKVKVGAGVNIVFEPKERAATISPIRPPKPAFSVPNHPKRVVNYALQK